jgi:hypothetical protein
MVQGGEHLLRPILWIAGESMDDQQSRRLFIVFITFILGLALGSGLVMYCSKGSASQQPATVSRN